MLFFFFFKQCLAVYFLPRTPPLGLFDPSGVGNVCRQWCIATEISHFSGEADWIATPRVALFSARQPAFSCRAPSRRPAQSVWQEGGKRQRRWLLFRFTSRRSQVWGVEVWIFLWDLLQMCVHLRNSLSKAGHEGSNLLLQTPVSYLRKSG